MLNQKIKQIKSGKLTAVENTLQFGEKIKKKNKDLNIFLHLNEEATKKAEEIDKRIKAKKAVGKLAGLCFAVKSNICVQGHTANCASKVLEQFVSPYNATVINKLIEEDAIFLGMVNMDEFASGSSGETSAYGPTKNPRNLELIPGGSSAGSAAAVAAEFCDFSLGSDTGGSIRNPASHCGVVGLKPTYGAVSRYGLLDLAMSFDVIGPLTNSTEDAKLIFDIIKGQDNFDTTTGENYMNFEGDIKSATKSPKRMEGGEPSKKKTKIKTIGIVKTQNICDKRISNIIEEKTKEIAKKNNLKIKEVELPLDIALETYYLITYVEFYSATRKYDGRRFGLKIDEDAGPEVMRRILGGEEITKAEFEGRYYNEALKARAFIKEQFEKIFKEVDAILLPTVPKLPHKLGKDLTVEEMYAYDTLTVPASIAGLPAISIPVGKIEEKDIGLQIIAPKFQEETLFEIGKELE